MFAHDHSKCRAADLRLNIFTAAQWGDLHSVMHAVEQRGVAASKPDDYGLTALHHACTKG
jgi:ankyrin repeat protein